MVGLQGLHKSDAFRCPNVSASVGLKSFCPWCWKLGGTPKWSLSILKRWHYRMVIVCNICQLFASMNAQSVLDHHSGCTTKHDKECMEQGGTGIGKNVTQEEVQVPGTKGGILITKLRGHQGVIKHGMPLNTFYLGPAREHKLVHFLNLSGSSIISVSFFRWGLTQSDELSFLSSVTMSVI